MKNIPELKLKIRNLLIEVVENERLIQNELMEYIEKEGREGTLEEAIGRLPLKDIEKIARNIENIVEGN